MAASSPPLRVVVEGCCHGELDQIYASIERLEGEHGGQKVDLLICCGDFQAVRNKEDLRSMNVPSKYLTMASFHKYYSGEAVAPVLTIFIGGNHEASNHMQELYYGGWVAPNIYYMGCAGVIRVGGVRIAGLSGIYNARDYRKGHYETPPYSPNTIRSIYHVREFEVFKLAQIQGALDVVLSHDWPRGVYHHGDMNKLLRTKPYFRQECETNTLGSNAAELLLHQLQPAFWFSGHLHCKFAAVVRHPGGGPSNPTKLTKFLALDKCLPNRDFLQLVEIPRPASYEGQPVKLEHDLEWLAIVRATHDLLSRSERDVQLPQESKMVSEEDKAWVRVKLEAAAKARGQDPAEALEIVPESFVRTAPAYNSAGDGGNGGGTLRGSPQTDALLALLELSHRVTIPYRALDNTSGGGGGDEANGDGDSLFFLDRGDGGGGGGGVVPSNSVDDPNAIDLDDEEEAEEGGEDVIVFKGTTASAPPPPAAPSRPKLVLPPPTSSAE